MGAIGQLGTSNLCLPFGTTASLSAISGAATTYTFTQSFLVFDGKQYYKATAAGAATPTADSAAAKLADGSTAGLSLATGYGTVCVWAANSGGTVTLWRGETVALDSGNAFTKAPNFPTLPDDVVAFGYTTHRNYSGSAFVIGTTNWNTGSTAHATQSVMVLPGRPQVS